MASSKMEETSKKLVNFETDFMLMEKRQNVGGYDNDFVEAVRDEWKCVICLMVLKDPVQIEDCGHVFCKTCFKDWIRSHGFPICCPADNVIIDRDKVFHDRRLDRQIKSLQVFCVNRKLGCMVKPELRYDEIHSVTCKCRIVSCPLKCGQYMVCWSMDMHKDKECRRRLITCTNCEENVEAQDKMIHTDSCCGAGKSHAKEMMINASKNVDNEISASTNRLGAKLPKEHFGETTTEMTSAAFSKHLEKVEKVNEQLLDQQELSQQLIEQLSCNVEKNRKANAVLENQVRELKNMMESMHKCAEIVEIPKDEAGVSMNEFDVISDAEETDQALTDDKKIGLKLKSQLKIHKRPFTWEIVLKRSMKREDSPLFYTTGGYRMGLSVEYKHSCKYAGDNWSLFGHLCEGEYDDNIQWPWSAGVKLKVVDVDAHKVLCDKFKSVFPKIGVFRPKPHQKEGSVFVEFLNSPNDHFPVQISINKR